MAFDKSDLTQAVYVIITLALRASNRFRDFLRRHRLPEKAFEDLSSRFIYGFLEPFVLKLCIRFILFFNNCLISLNNFRILFHQTLYFIYLTRKRLVLFGHGIRVRFSLFKCERQLIAKYGRNWRCRVLNDEIIQFLQISDYIHGRGKCNRVGMNVASTEHTQQRPITTPYNPGSKL